MRLWIGLRLVKGAYLKDGKHIHHAVRLGELMIAFLLGGRTWWEKEIWGCRGVCDPDNGLYVHTGTDRLVLPALMRACQGACQGVSIVSGSCSDGTPKFRCMIMESSPRSDGGGVS